MATRLIQTIAFSNLAASSTTVLPHEININGTPKLPDLVMADATGFTVTVDEFNVTVVNNNPIVSSVNVWLEHKHTIPRQLGSTEIPNLTPQPFYAVDSDADLESEPIPMFVYRPMTDAFKTANPQYAPGGNVYTDWYALMAKIAETKYLGMRFLQFDNRFAPNPNTDPLVMPFLVANGGANAPVPNNTVSLGLWPAAILPPRLGIDPAAWDMTDVIWTDRGMAPGLDSMLIQIYDGGAGRPCRIDGLKRIEGMIPNLIYNGRTVGNYPFMASRSVTPPNAGPFYGWVFEGVRFRMYNTDSQAKPMWLSDTPTSFFDVQNNAVFGLNPFAPTAACPAPVIEIASNCTLVLFGKRTTSVANNTLTGAGNLQIDTYFSEVWGNAEDPVLSQWLQPAFSGAILPMRYTCTTQRFRPSSTVVAHVTGTGDSLAFSPDIVTLTDAGAVFTAAMVGRPITIAGATAPGNNGTFTIASVISGTQLTYTNAGGVAVTEAFTWDIEGAAFFGEVTRVNTASAILVVLPKASVTLPTTGTFPQQGAAITVLDATGNAAAANITVRATIGDTINGSAAETGAGESDQLITTNYGSARFWNDGLGAWFIIA